MIHVIPSAHDERDAELQPWLARDALHGVNHLLAAQPRGELIAAHEIAAIIHLIAQASGYQAAQR